MCDFGSEKLGGVAGDTSQSGALWRELAARSLSRPWWRFTERSLLRLVCAIDRTRSSDEFGLSLKDVGKAGDLVE